jgi:hypothetical protein
MSIDRRQFLRNAGTLGTLAAAGTAAGCAPPAATPAAPPARTLEPGLATNLTLLTFREQGEHRLGVKTERGVLDVARAGALLNLHAPATLDAMLQQEDGPSVQAVVKAALEGSTADAAFRPEAGIEYGPLVSSADKIVCVGLNYREHAKEIGSPIPAYPVLFNKFNGSLNRHQGTVKLPTDLATNFDYEVELVIVMGRTAFRVVRSPMWRDTPPATTSPPATCRAMVRHRRLRADWPVPGDGRPDRIGSRSSAGSTARRASRERLHLRPRAPLHAEDLIFTGHPAGRHPQGGAAGVAEAGRQAGAVSSWAS